ncbi:ABC transporter permease (plasmid) [Legionella adelaidensis]|uniref:ABC transporter permease n=1 Tax=Legionella adelaidensis TaxID=45056 RepID=A0A0W0R447_9GAMM|nr:ABC transporter permease [Legionella adelaidensis]VEH85244.1 ABC transporter permease [Legionella adelaidensis]
MKQKIKPQAQFSFSRLMGLVAKEFTQLRRDRFTFALIIGLPLIQLILFGLAINANPKYLPSALINYDTGPFSRELIYGLENTHYFKFMYFPSSSKEADKLMVSHEVQFILTIPSDFSQKIVRGEYPAALLEVDGTDPVSVGYAVSASSGLMQTIFQHSPDLPGGFLNENKTPADLRVQVRYNPSAITQYNIVPGLLGLVLTMTFVMVASMALTREKEMGTLESLLATSLLPSEVVIGKTLPFLLIGYAQVFIILLMAIFFFNIPFLGSFILLLLVTLPFILANLFVGIFFSTFSSTQLEASQLSTFFMIPSLLLSGFAFPFKGMPIWAQWFGNILPLTHFNNIVRGIMLKGVGIQEVFYDVWPIILFLLIALFLAMKHYRRTLD